MICKRCTANIPDFLWVDDDHPVLIHGRPMLLSRQDNLEDNTITVTAQLRVQKRLCSDVFVVKEEQIVDVGGISCLVVHLTEDQVRHDGMHYAYCDGEMWMPPDENEKRPRTLCEACRLKSLKPRVTIVNNMDMGDVDWFNKLQKKDQ